MDSILARLSQGILAKGRQGVERRIPIHLLETLALTVDLSGALRLPFKEAFDVAASLLGAPPDSSGGSATARFGEFSRLHVDRDALRYQIEERLALAIESVVRPRRGRPPARDTP